jgi:three-Cys-motif partner protein
VTARPKTTTWKAAPHTLAKIRILSTYLQAWFQIMGRSQRGKDILYIDGFAGPGSYANHAEGSPLAALRVLSEARKSVGKNWVAGDVHVALVEQEPSRHQALRSAVEPFRQVPNLLLHLYSLPFEEALRQLQAAAPRFFGSPVPLFAFIDPFGVKGFSFGSLRMLFSNPMAEVLVNFDADGVARVLRAGEAADHAVILTSIYGSDEWRSLNPDASMPALVRSSMNLYRERLKTLADVRYVFAFEMRTRRTSIDYYLVFASRHPLGLEKMKEAMRSVDQSGGYQFCDATGHQGDLFRFDDPANYAHVTMARFLGKTVPYEDVRDFVLNETPFATPGSILKELEHSGRLSVMSRNPNRRRYTYKPEDTVALTFIDPKS